MMKEVSVLIIESNVTVRLSVSRIIRETDNVSLGGAYDCEGLDNLIAAIRDNNTSVVLLGIEKIKSCEMDLFLFLRKRFPSLPIIPITTLDEEGAAIAIETLKRGAVDYITRPVNHFGILHAHDHLEKRLVPLLKSVTRFNLDSSRDLVRADSDDEQISGSAERDFFQPVEIVVVSGCTGGVPALYPLLAGLPRSLRVPVIIVQHMPKIYTNMLARDLNIIAPLRVREALNDSMLIPGNVYVVPGGYHAEVRVSGNKKSICLHRGPKEQGNRPSTDHLIRSVSQVYRDKALQIILSGSGDDGLNGARALFDAGGQVILQNPGSSMIWDLPQKIADLGYQSGVRHPKRMGMEVSSRVPQVQGQKSVTQSTTGSFINEKWQVV